MTQNIPPQGITQVDESADDSAVQPDTVSETPSQFRQKLFFRSLRMAVLVYFIFMIIVIGMGMTGWVESQFFYPDSYEYSSLGELGIGAQAVSFSSRDGLTLSGCFIPAVGDVRGTIIQSHGNAQNYTAHGLMVNSFVHDGYNIFLFDYRGFGESAGKPGLQGALSDCHAALDYVLTRDDVDSDRIFWIGHSLGGSFGILITAERKEIKALILDSPFSGFSRIVADVMRQSLIYRPFTWMASMLIPKMEDPVDRIADIAPRPVLIICGDQDQVVPPAMSRELFDAAVDPKDIIELADIRHLEAFDARLVELRPRILDCFEKATND